MGRTATQTPGPYELAVADAIRRELGSRRISNREIARQSGRSEAYIRARINDERPFSISDIESICAALEMDPVELLTQAHRGLGSK